MYILDVIGRMNMEFYTAIGCDCCHICTLGGVYVYSEWAVTRLSITCLT